MFWDNDSIFLEGLFAHNHVVVIISNGKSATRKQQNTDDFYAFVVFQKRHAFDLFFRSDSFDLMNALDEVHLVIQPNIFIHASHKECFCDI
jgi:predicted ATPase